jgi:hypothetical protein
VWEKKEKQQVSKDIKKSSTDMRRLQPDQSSKERRRNRERNEAIDNEENANILLADQPLYCRVLRIRCEQVDPA